MLNINQTHHGHVMDLLKQLPDKSINCCVTSPPYWGLRDYGLEPQIWGGDEGCEHEFTIVMPPPRKRNENDIKDVNSKEATKSTSAFNAKDSNLCTKCNAWQGSYGMEPTPELYVKHTVIIFREIRRVLADHGTLWLNLGDSYAGSGGAHAEHHANPGLSNSFDRKGVQHFGHVGQPERYLGPKGLKPKDLAGIPWAIAQALRAPFYSGKIKDESDKKWLAAMIDGEGCISGFDIVRKDDNRIRTGVNINITNSNIPLLDECFRIYPTSRKEHNSHSENRFGNKPTMRWIVHGCENKSLFLEEIWPYLIAKKKQAIIAWNFLQLQKKAKHYGKTIQKNEIIDKRQYLVSLISKLNKGNDIDLPNFIKEPKSLYESGWYLRSDIIWNKPNPMPESVTDRPTKSHEYIFLLTKSPKYFYDADAIKENLTESSIGRLSQDIENQTSTFRANGGAKKNGPLKAVGDVCGGRNKRSVWEVTTKPFSEAHFATFPPDLIAPCIKAGCPEQVCTKCGLPREKVFETAFTEHTGKTNSQYHEKTTGGRLAKLRQASRENGQEYVNNKKPIGYTDCGCNTPFEPGIVLDPFMGAGTTAMVAQKLNRNYIGIELNADYIKIGDKRMYKELGMFMNSVTEPVIASN